MKYLLVGCGTIAVLLVAVAIVFIVRTASGASTIELSEYHPFRSAEAKAQYLAAYDRRAEEWPVPSETRMISTSYGQTFVRISGPAGAPPLVLLHGVSGNSLQWIPNVEAWSESFRVYAVDTINDYGRSVYTRPITSADDYVTWLDELFNALELGDDVNLVGVSYGGWLTSQYALRFPERLDKIVLLAPAGTVRPLRPAWILRALLSALPHRYFTQNFMYWLLDDAVHKDEASRQWVDRWVDDAYLAVRSFKSRPMVNPTVLTDGELRGLEVPALYLVGENEKICSAQEAVERLNEVAPQIETDIIPDAGHDLTLVQADRVNRKVLAFLKEP